MNHDTRHDDRPAVVVTAAGQVAVGAGVISTNIDHCLYKTDLNQKTFSGAQR